MPNHVTRGAELGKFIVLYHAPTSALQAMEAMQNMTPEEMQKGMEPWMAWAARCGDSLVDMGSPLGGGRNVTSSGSSPSGKDVTGYSVLEAETMEAALALLDGHPHLAWGEGFEIEIHESLPMTM